MKSQEIELIVKSYSFATVVKSIQNFTLVDFISTGTNAYSGECSSPLERLSSSSIRVAIEPICWSFYFVPWFDCSAALIRSAEVLFCLVV